jgi:hypothetical protein
VTIGERINLVHLAGVRLRLAKLVEARADDIAIQRLKAEAERLESEGIKVTGDNADALLRLEYISVEVRSGKAPYLHFCTKLGNINYFPEAKRGPFISICNGGFRRAALGLTSP